MMAWQPLLANLHQQSPLEEDEGAVMRSPRFRHLLFIQKVNG